MSDSDPTEEEISRMSDREILQRLDAIVGNPPGGRRRLTGLAAIVAKAEFARMWREMVLEELAKQEIVGEEAERTADDEEPEGA